MTALEQDGQQAAQVAPHRLWLREWLESYPVRSVILGLILFNAVTLGLSTSPTVMARMGGVVNFLDTTVLWLFVIELSVKLYAYGRSFFRNAWNVFDLIVVGVGLLPEGQASGVSALRGLRVIRALRILSAVPQMRAVVQALLDALPGMGAVIVMLSVVFYVFSVMATIMFGPDFPEWFGTVGRSAYSLFQIMTLESWSMGIVRPVMEAYPLAWMFFIPFILCTTFTVLNLFIGIIVSAMQAEHDATAEEERAGLGEQNTAILKELKALRTEVAALTDERP